MSAPAATSRASFGARVLTVARRPRVFMLLTWLAQFLLMLMLFFFLGPNTPHGLATLELPAERLVEIWGFSDAGSYLQAAQNLVANGTGTREWAWVLNLWPPGMVWLDAIVLYASPLPFGVTIAFISSLMWSLTFAVLAWPFLTSRKAAVVVLIVELAVLASSPFQSWMFDEWPFYADGFAVAPFLLGLGIIANRVRVSADRLTWIRDGIFVGIAFSVTIYMRASYQLVPWMLAATGVLLVVLILVKRRRGRPTAALAKQLLFVAAAVGSIVLLLAPYAAYTYQSKGRIAFVQTEDLVYEHVWEDPERDAVPQWMLNGGSTLGCDIDEATCELVHDRIAEGDGPTPAELRDLLIQAVLAHPVEFVGNRVHYVSSQWFGDELTSYSRTDGDYTSGPVSYSMANNLNPPQNLLYLGLLIAAVVGAVMLVRRGEWLLLIIPGSVLVLLAPFAFVHVEVRYLIPLKLIGLLAPVLLLIIRERRAARADTTPAGDD